MISFTYASDNGFPFFDARNYVRFGFVRIDHEIDKLRLDRFKLRSLSVRAVRFTRNECVLQQSPGRTVITANQYAF